MKMPSAKTEESAKTQCNGIMSGSIDLKAKKKRSCCITMNQNMNTSGDFKMKKMLLVYNPVAGDKRIQSALSDLVNTFTKKGYIVTVYPTQSAGDAKYKLARLQVEYDRIVVCGGDGMLHEALNGWMNGTDMPLLGYIPTGTVNDFAHSHHLPFSVLEAAEIAAGDSWTNIDVGKFNDEYFSYVAAFGIGTSVSYRTAQNKKNRLGSLAYVIEAIGAVDFAHWENNCETMRIKWEGGECEGEFLYGMVSNSRYIAGSDRFTRNLFNWRDGLLEGVFIRRPMNITDLNAIAMGIMQSKFDHPLFVAVQSPWFTFEGSKTPWTLDGEFGGDQDFVRAQAVPEALRIALPLDHVSQTLELESPKNEEELDHGKAEQNAHDLQTANCERDDDVTDTEEADEKHEEKPDGNSVAKKRRPAISGLRKGFR